MKKRFLFIPAVIMAALLLCGCGGGDVPEAPPGEDATFVYDVIPGKPVPMTPLWAKGFHETTGVFPAVAYRWDITIKPAYNSSLEDGSLKTGVCSAGR